MLIAPNIDPIAVQIGPLAIHWYGLMYLIGFVLAYLLARVRARRADSDWSLEQISDLIFYCALGVLIGGRVGYVLFYNIAGLLADPLYLFRIWEGGMSFHGGLLGVFLAIYFVGKKFNKPYFAVTDFVAPLVPLGLAAGRLGNFINGNLWGKVSDVPWAMAPVPGAMPRHPTQLYEFLLEGLVLFAIVWLYSSRPRPLMTVTGVFLVGYGAFRCFVEFYRLPDAHIGYLAWDWLTMGQVLSFPMLLLGFFMWIAGRRAA